MLHRQPCFLCPLQRHGGIPSAPDTPTPTEAQGREHSISQGSWMQRMPQLRASSRRSSWLPHITWPGFGQVPRQHCHEKALFNAGHAMSYTAWKVPHELHQFSAGSLCGQRVFWLSATTKPPIPTHNSRKRGVLYKEAFSPSLS